MLTEVVNDRPRGDVRNALAQFAARRRLAIRKGWWSEDQFEIMRESGANTRLRISLHRRRGRSVTQIESDADQESAALAYELRVYLESDTAYAPELPLTCPSCGRAVKSAAANFCGCCGKPLTGKGEGAE